MVHGTTPSMAGVALGDVFLLLVVRSLRMLLQLVKSDMKSVKYFWCADSCRSKACNYERCWRLACQRVHRKPWSPRRHRERWNQFKPTNLKSRWRIFTFDGTLAFCMSGIELKKRFGRAKAFATNCFLMKLPLFFRHRRRCWHTFCS